MRTTFTIMRRELRANFDSPVAYVVLCLTMMALAAWIFKGSVWARIPTFWDANRASYEVLFSAIPYGLALLVVPVLTMRVMAEERRSGTLEMLITLPVKDHEVIIGKFLGTWLVVLMLIATTLLYPIIMFKAPLLLVVITAAVFGAFIAALFWPSDEKSMLGYAVFVGVTASIVVFFKYAGVWDFGALDWGPIEAGYIGLIVYSAAITAFGLFVSSLFENQIIAFFTTWFVLAVLHFIGAAASWLDNDVVKKIVNLVSFDTRLMLFNRGIISIRDLVYFLSIAIISLMASFAALERRKWA